MIRPLMDAATVVATANVLRERLGIAEVIKATGVSKPTWARKVKAGQAPAHHYILGTRKWFADEIAEWVTRQMAQGEAARQRHLSKMKPQITTEPRRRTAGAR